MASKTEHSIILKAFDETRGAFIKANARVMKMAKSVQAAGKKMSMAFTVPLVGMAAASLKAASTFEKGMSNVSTLVDTNVESMEEMSQAVLKMSTATDQAAVPLEDMTGALFDIRSAGVQAGDAMNVLSSAAKLGVAGLGSTKQAADLGTSAIKAFGLKGKEATQVFDTFFATTRAGKTTIAELSQGFGSVAGIVASSDIKVAEFMATTAALTTTGLKASEAYTQQKAIIAGLTRQTEDTAKVFKKLGVRDFPELVKQSGGWQNALERVAAGLNVVGTDSKRARKALKRLGVANFKALIKQEGTAAKAFTKLAEEVGRNDKTLLKALGSTEALNAVLALTGPLGNEARDAFDTMGEGANNLEVAFAKQNKTSAAGMQRMRNSVNRAAISLGKVLGPVAAKVADIITSVANAFEGLDDDTKEFIVTVGAVVAVVGPLLIIGGKMVTGFLAIKGAVVGATAALKAMRASSDAASGSMAGATKSAGRLGGAMGALTAATAAFAVGWQGGKWIDDATGLSDKLAGVSKKAKTMRESALGLGISEERLAAMGVLSPEMKAAERRKASERAAFGRELTPEELAQRRQKGLELSRQMAASRAERMVASGAPGAPGKGGEGGTVKIEVANLPQGSRVRQTGGRPLDIKVGRQLAGAGAL